MKQSIKYKNAEKKSLRILDWVIILGIVLLVYMIAEEGLYQFSEATDTSIIIVAFFSGGIIFVLLKIISHTQFLNPFVKYILTASLAGGLLLSMYITLEEIVLQISSGGSLSRLHFTIIILLILVSIGLLRYSGREKKFVKKVADNV